MITNHVIQDGFVLIYIVERDWDVLTLALLSAKWLPSNGASQLRSHASERGLCASGGDMSESQGPAAEERCHRSQHKFSHKFTTEIDQSTDAWSYAAWGGRGRGGGRRERGGGGGEGREHTGVTPTLVQYTEPDRPRQPGASGLCRPCAYRSSSQPSSCVTVR